MQSHISGYGQVTAKRRLTSLLLALAINGLLLLALLAINPQLIRPRKESRMPVSFSMEPSPEPARQNDSRRDKAEEKETVKAPPTPEKAKAPAEQEPPAARPELPFLVLSSKDFAGSDIRALPKGATGKPSGGESAATYGPGEGPGGEQLFNADWFRRPTDAELSTYIPANAPPDGWGMVACQTVEDNRVENCRAIGESPMGSGFARAVRQAAWQFRVIPPRIGGRPQIGAWVRIRIDYIRGVARSN